MITQKYDIATTTANMEDSRTCHPKRCLFSILSTKGHGRPAERGKALKTRHEFSFCKGNFHL